jgi:hypothetical protein
VKPQPAPANGWDWVYPINRAGVTPGTKVAWRADIAPPSTLGHCYCPYGKPGEDLIYAKETWASPESDKKKRGRIAYNADGECGCWVSTGEYFHHGRVLEADGYRQCFPRKNGDETYSLGKYTDIRSGEYPSYRYGWRSAMFMPRWAARLWFELVDVRVERLQDISEADAKAEGCRETLAGPDDGPFAGGIYTAKCDYMMLWDSLNGKKPGCAWADNPWVWALALKRITPPDSK